MKWGKKGYDLDSATDKYQAEITYFYAMGLYKNGNVDDAKEIYKKAIRLDGKHSLRNKFTIIGGTPCIIKSLLVQNSRYDNSIINKAGTTLYDDKTEFLEPVIELIPLRTGHFDFKVKLYENGTLKTMDDSSEDYTYIHNVLLISEKDWDGSWYFDSSKEDYPLIQEKDTVHQVFPGVGKDKPGYWRNGGYRIEIWWEDEKLATYSFNIYNGWGHTYGYGNVIF